jgi:hypothetical protein
MSQEAHEGAGRVVSRDKAADVLYEELSAWDQAAVLLAQPGLAEHIFGDDGGEAFWDSFHMMRSVSVVTYTHDFAAAHHVEELIARKGTECPSCRSSLLAVLGFESRQDLALVCLECNTHSRPHRTRDALCRALRHKTRTFTNVCHCAKNKEKSLAARERKT